MGLYSSGKSTDVGNMVALLTSTDCFPGRLRFCFKNCHCVREEGSPQTMGRGKVADSLRKLIFNADRADDGANYTCEVRHSALEESGAPPRTATVNLGVLCEYFRK